MINQKILLKLSNKNLKIHTIEREPQTSDEKLSWTDNFKKLCDTDKKFAKYWFWDNFDWSSQSIWIGKFNKMNHLPPKNEQINSFLKKLVDDMDTYHEMKSLIYIKFYFSRNISSGEPDINYLLVCNTPKLPTDFANTLTDVVFEKYQLTEAIVNKECNFKNLIDHYINWNNFYTYYDLMGELQY